MKPQLDEKEKAIILGYDVEALKKNIERHRSNIEVFRTHIGKAEEDIKILQSYIRMIEEAGVKSGNRLRSHK